MSNLKRRSFEDGLEIVTQLKKSGLSQVKFAEKLGLSVAVVRYWILKLRKEKRKIQQVSKVRFVEVIPKPTPPSVQP